MSYDIDIVEVKYSSNYTSNICNMLSACCNSLYEQGFFKYKLSNWYDYITDVWSEDIKQNLRLIIKELKSEPDKYKKLQPPLDPNTGERWGTYDGAIQWLQTILDNYESGYKIIVDC